MPKVRYLAMMESCSSFDLALNSSTDSKYLANILAQQRISDVGLLLLISTFLPTGAALVSVPHDFALAAAAANGDSMPAHEISVMAGMTGHHAGPTALAWVFGGATGISLVVPLALRRYRRSLTDEPWISDENLVPC